MHDPTDLQAVKKGPRVSRSRSNDVAGAVAVAASGMPSPLEPSSVAGQLSRPVVGAHQSNNKPAVKTSVKGNNNNNNSKATPPSSSATSSSVFAAAVADTPTPTLPQGHTSISPQPLITAAVGAHQSNQGPQRMPKLGLKRNKSNDSSRGNNWVCGNNHTPFCRPNPMVPWTWYTPVMVCYCCHPQEFRRYYRCPRCQLLLLLHHHRRRRRRRRKRRMISSFVSY